MQSAEVFFPLALNAFDRLQPASGTRLAKGTLERYPWNLHRLRGHLPITALPMQRSGPLPD